MNTKKAFWDTDILLYWIEQEKAHLPQTKALVEWQKTQGIETVTSAYSLAEILVRPIAKGQAELARKYSNQVKKMGCIEFGANEALAYACIRADHPDIRPPECIQLACAVAHGVDYFFTNDRKLSRINIDGIGEIIYLKSWYEARR